MRLKTFILNMPQRQERKMSIEKEFENKSFFDTELVCPVTHKEPHISHWLSFKQAVERAKDMELPVFLFCEDDHVFTKAFDERKLERLIYEADVLEADLLLGGISWIRTTLQINERLFWTKQFNGTQFVIVFSRFYEKILERKQLDCGVVTDFTLSELSNRIFIAYPFISIQKEFGYSDVTPKNNKKGYVRDLFKGTERKLEIQNKVRKFYMSQCQ